MDVRSPGSTLAGGLVLPILRVLTRRADALTASQVRARAGTGTDAGVRRALDRLAASGLVDAVDVGGRTVFTLNRDHLLVHAVEALLDADTALVARLRTEIAGWPVSPTTALLYGSAARRDGDTTSDIDVMLAHEPMTDDSRDAWEDQVAALREAVQRWTGNRAQILTREVDELRRLVRDREPIVERWRDEGVLLAGDPLDALVRTDT